jgi:two-component system, sensor histidine kinase
MNGYELAAHLRRDPATDGVFLVAMTGYGQPEDRQRALEAGFDEHLVKPADLQRLREVFHVAAQRCAAVA